jgi:hypothetical protein
VTWSFISSCSSASVHSLPCGPRMAEEKESGFPTPSRFKSAGAGEYTGNSGGGQSGREEGLKAGAAAGLW